MSLNRARAWLFVPGGRAELLEKTRRWQPDVVVLDLEDAVGRSHKDQARSDVVAALNADRHHPVTLIRVNGPATPWFSADLDAAAASRADGILIPKVEDTTWFEQVRVAFGSRLVVAGLETALGVADARMLLTAGFDAVYFGAEDFVADVGGRRTAESREVLFARSHIALCARLAGVPAIDQVVLEVGDEERFRRDAVEGRALGYAGKLCVHPDQVALARETFAPSAEEVRAAEAVMASVASGAGLLDGRMIDEVHVRMAQAILADAGVG